MDNDQSPLEVAGGALGNMTDRVRFGRVVDFLDFRAWLQVWTYIFNLADVAIVIGSAVLALHLIRNGKSTFKLDLINQ